MDKQEELIQRRHDREKRARKQAEQLIEEKSRELYHANQELLLLTGRLEKFNSELECRVDEATRDLLFANESLLRRVNELRALNAVAVAITSVTERDTLLEQIMQVSTEVMNAEASSLLLLDSSKGTLQFNVARGEAGAALKSLSVNPGQGIAGTVLQTGESILVANAYQDPRFEPSFDQQSGFRTRSLLAVPIRAKNKLIGVLEVINKIGHDTFDQHDLILFESFAGIAAVALENAALFAKTKKMADELRDALKKERRLNIEKEKMGAYISNAVVTEISRSREKKLALGGKMVRATILFSDIKGFTNIAEQMSPERLVNFLNVYMTAMTEIIAAHGGVVDKFVGDGIMAVYVAADQKDNHSLRAVQAGIQMQHKVYELRKKWNESDVTMQRIQIRIGINTGDVVAGNIGSLTRMDYTVIGDNVNVAARIESACAPDEVWVSESTFQELGGTIAAVKMDPIKVKNREQAVQIYSIELSRVDDTARMPAYAGEITRV